MSHLYNPNTQQWNWIPQAEFPYAMHKKEESGVKTIFVHNREEIDRYTAEGYGMAHIPQEFPLAVYRVADGKLESLTVHSEAQKKNALEDGYTTDYASLVNDDGTPKAPEVKPEKGNK